MLPKSKPERIPVVTNTKPSLGPRQSPPTPVASNPNPASPPAEARLLLGVVFLCFSSVWLPTASHWAAIECRVF